MPETLLSPSNILLFGRKVSDLRIVRPERPLSGAESIEARLATTEQIELGNLPTIDNVPTKAGDTILVKDQERKSENGVYTVGDCDPWARACGADSDDEFRDGLLVDVKEGKENQGTWELKSFKPPLGRFPVAFERFQATDDRHGPFVEPRKGPRSELEDQLVDRDAVFARIYALSYEGVYYDLATPVIFLVHGEGADVTETLDNTPLGVTRPARAPGSPSLTGLSEADFQFTEDLRVWSYDKADYTIRMDVATGMFEQLLLGPELDDEPIDAFVSGQRARMSGQRARVSGQRARVSGQRVRLRDRGGD